MKATMSILAAAVLIIAATTVAAAADTSTPLTAEQYARAEQNLLIGLESDNQGVKESSAYMLGEIKSAKAVVPLMKMLRSDDRSPPGSWRHWRSAALAMPAASMP